MEHKSATGPLHDTATSVTICTQDDIRERQLSDLVDLSRNVPGLDVRTGARGGVAFCQERGGSDTISSGPPALHIAWPERTPGQHVIGVHPPSTDIVNTLLEFGGNLSDNVAEAELQLIGGTLQNVIGNNHGNASVILSSLNLNDIEITLTATALFPVGAPTQEFQAELVATAYGDTVDFSNTASLSISLPAGKPGDVISQRTTLELALRVLESAPSPRTTMQSPLRWSSDPAWKHDYCSIDHLAPEALAQRRHEFDAQKAVAQTKRDGIQAGRWGHSEKGNNGDIYPSCMTHHSLQQLCKWYPFPGQPCFGGRRDGCV